MGISVKISGPIPTLDEVAKRLGISGKRRRDLERIADEVTQDMKTSHSRSAASSKRSTPSSKAA
jgi:hypothetical protein